MWPKPNMLVYNVIHISLSWKVKYEDVGKRFNYNEGQEVGYKTGEHPPLETKGTLIRGWNPCSPQPVSKGDTAAIGTLGQSKVEAGAVTSNLPYDEKTSRVNGKVSNLQSYYTTT